MGVPEGWGRELPGVIRERDAGGRGAGEGEEGKGREAEKMKIAWRYERLGQFGEERVGGSRGGSPAFHAFLYILLRDNVYDGLDGMVVQSI